MIFVYVDGRKGLDTVFAAMDWMNDKIGPESPTTWFRVTVDNCDIFHIGNQYYRHLRHSWVICDHEHATAFKLKFPQDE